MSSTHRTPFTRTRWFTSLALVGLLASACTDGSSGVVAERSNEAGDTGGDEQVSGQEQNVPPLEWGPCDDASNAVVELECATLEVPLDHADSTGPQIEIAVARSAATGGSADRIGSLVFNPGGPGGSGIESLGFIPLTMSPEILSRFDIVSFDPRGVGSSTALECDNDLDDEVTLLADGDDAGWEALVDEIPERIASCTAATLELADFVGTNNAARDMELLRQALGDEGLSYVGYSYGTRLGATYAELFPDKVRALVLDAGVKPVRDSAELTAEQGGGFDRALTNFAAACAADVDCLLNELGPALDVIADLRSEIAATGSFPAGDDGRVLTPGELDFGIAAALYSKDSWPFLASGLYIAAVDRDGSVLQALADSLAGRQVDGSYDNSQVANGFINCADDPARPTEAEQQQLSDEAADDSTYFDEFLRASTGCLGIDPALDPLVIGPAVGAAPIVVIGNTGDPATPFEWSVALAASLDSAVLYTVEAEGHTAYGTIECVQSDIDAYLLDLVVPAEGATCSDNADNDFFVPDGEGGIDQVVAFFDCVRDQGVDVADVGLAEVLADPTLESIFSELDLTDPAVGTAFATCQELLPGA